MAFGKRFKRAVGSVVNVVPGGSQIVKATSNLPINNLIGSSILQSGVKQVGREQAGAAQMADALTQQQAATAEQARLKLIADESVRLQEEAARKKTVFGGDSQQQTLERRKLLGI